MTAKRERKDRLWLVVAATVNVALAVTLNKYSASLPVWVVLALWGVAGAFFVYWVVRAESTRDWLNRRFREHPISYVLALLILVPFFGYATSLMIAKLRAPKPNEAKHPAISNARVQSEPARLQPAHELPKADSAPRILPVPPARKTLEKSTKATQKINGNGSQQVQTGDNSVVQTMTNSPGGLQVGHDLTVIGSLPLPNRELAPDNVRKAVELLKGAPQGTAILFVTYPTQVPENSEISQFTLQLQRVFSQAGWYPYRERNYFLGSVTIMGNNGMSHGEGVGCSAPMPPTPESQLAERALAVLHVPCSHPSILGPEDSGGKSNFAFYLSVGQR